MNGPYFTGLYISVFLLTFLSSLNFTKAAGVNYGSGSYAGSVPPGYPVPSDFNNNPVQPKVSSTFNQPVVTNKFWSSFIYKFHNHGSHSLNVYPHPLVVKGQAQGLDVHYPTHPTSHVFNNAPGNFIEAYWYNDQRDFTLGLEGLNAGETKVDSYSDWMVTTNWNDGVRDLKVTLGHGFPYLYAKGSGGSAKITFNGTPVVWADQGSVRGVTVNGHHYALFAPTGSAWTGSNVMSAALSPSKNYFSVAVLPSQDPALLQRFKEHAYVFPTNTITTWDYDTQQAKVNTHFNIESDVLEGNENQPLITLYPHQWRNSQLPLIENVQYISPRGILKLAEASSFTTSVKTNGLLPSFPTAAGVDRERLRAYIDQYYQHPNLFPAGDVYFSGKEMGRVRDLIHLAHDINYPEARDYFLNRLKGELENWLTYSGPGDNKFIAYNSQWKTATAYPESFFSAAMMNDHHFDYGYYVMAAATLAQFDPSWASDTRWGPMVELLIKDSANWDRSDTRFPFLRTFDPYEGHSWASGHSGFDSGANQESTSEAINYAAGIALWGAAKGNNTIRDLGLMLYANEIAAIEEYWFDMHNENFPSNFTRKVVGMIWSNGASYSTWWTASTEEIHGINILPLTGASLYLGRDPNFVRSNYQHMMETNGGPEAFWYDILWSYLALADPNLALQKFESNPSYPVEEGDSRARTYHWIRGLQDFGQLDYSVIADSPTAVTFIKNGVRTHVAYNPSQVTMTVNFSDGASLSVPPRSSITDQGGGGLLPELPPVTPPPNPDPSPEPDPTPDPTPGPTPTPDPSPDPGPSPNPEPDPQPEPSPEPDPEPVPDPAPDPDNLDAYTRIEAEWAPSIMGANISNMSHASNDRAVSQLKNGTVLRFDNVNFGTENPFQVYLRIGSNTSGSALVELRRDTVNGPLLTDLGVTGTGGWTSWKTIPMNMGNPTTGKHTVFLTVKTSYNEDILNLDWIQFGRRGDPVPPESPHPPSSDPLPEPDPTPDPTPSPDPQPEPAPDPDNVDAYSRIEAEWASDLIETNIEQLSGASQGMGLVGLKNASVAKIENVDFGSDSPFQVYLRMASNTSGSALVELRLDSVEGPLVTDLGVSGTGGWTTWKTIPMNIANPMPGKHTLYVLVKTSYAEDILNLDWIQFAKRGDPVPSDSAL